MTGSGARASRYAAPVATSAGRVRGQRQAFSLPPLPEAVSEARRRVVAVVGFMLSAAERAQLALVISEVVSNAVRHGGRPGHVDVAVTPKDGYLCVQVTDSGAGFAPTPRATAPDENGGFGLVLLEQLTRRWGLTRENGRTRVWFEFDVQAL